MLTGLGVKMALAHVAMKQKVRRTVMSIPFTTTASSAKGFWEVLSVSLYGISVGAGAVAGFFALLLAA